MAAVLIVAGHTKRRQRYAEWLAGQNIRFNFGDEIAAWASRIDDGVLNDTPPIELWADMIPTVRMLERIREVFGPTRIISAYRTVAYNAVQDGSAKDSQHIHNRAIDFKTAKGTPKDWALQLHEWRSAGAFRGGIGVYKTFVHVDTRGVNADWTG